MRIHNLPKNGFPQVQNVKQRRLLQCFFSSRNIGQVTLKNMHVDYLKEIFSGSKYPKNLFI